ncbi:uncharacterized protein LOC102902205 isoform X3 [Felis catus]|uniref:uncharacterized protein LOC102902205 isoform X3 n=1 Tax=Felis catus TaxID=9685 RepID=UPI001D1991FE|nr:uncharacterized protein LOC102902205 isoform X3 [Felis catus]
MTRWGRMSPAAAASNPLGMTRVLCRRRSALVPALFREGACGVRGRSAPAAQRRLFKGRLVRPLPRRLAGHRPPPLPSGGVGPQAALGLFTGKVAVSHTFLPLSEEWARNESYFLGNRLRTRQDPPERCSAVETEVKRMGFRNPRLGSRPAPILDRIAQAPLKREFSAVMEMCIMLSVWVTEVCAFVKTHGMVPPSNTYFINSLCEVLSVEILPLASFCLTAGR